MRTASTSSAPVATASTSNPQLVSLNVTTNAPRSTVAAFAADPTSCAQARAFVRESLERLQIDPRLVDVIVLVASELVTNAVLHAHAGPVVTVHSDDDSVRLEVEDSSEMFPLVRGYGSDAVTGRGLDVVDASASNWGVEVTQNGKTIWAVFKVHDTDEQVDEEPFVSAGTGAANIDADAPDTYEVVFRDVPVDDYLQLEQHHEALLREFELLLIGLETDTTNTQLDPAVITLVREVQPILSARLSALRPQVAAARTAGKSHCDLRGYCNNALIIWTKHFERLMDDADRLSHEGLLLTAPASSVVVEMRQWFLDEMMRQFVDRLPPRPAPSFHHS